MKLSIIFSLFAFTILTLASSTSKLTTTSTAPLTSSTTHDQLIRGSSSAIAAPYALPEWELKNRDRWIPIHNGRPCPNEDGCPENAYSKPTKITKRALPAITSISAASALTTRAMNLNSGASTSSENITQHPSSTTVSDSLITALSPTITIAPLTNHDLAPGQVAIPYIPADWTTITQCPAVFGSPCTTVSKYLPYINDGARRMSEEAARAASLIENGAFVPGMKVPGGAGMAEIRFAFVFAACVATMMAIMVVL